MVGGIDEEWETKRKYCLFKAGFARCPKHAGESNEVNFTLSLGNPFDHENMQGGLKALKKTLIMRKASNSTEKEIVSQTLT